MGIENLNEDEKEQLLKLMDKAEGVEEEPQVELARDPATGEWTMLPNPGSPTIERVLDPASWVDRQISNMKASGRKNYLIGITRPKKSPREAALAGHEKYKEKMRDEAVLQRQHDNRAKVSDDEWLAMSETLGADRLVSGVEKHEHKIRNFVEKWNPLLKNHLAKIDSMPNVSDADMEARMLENRRGLKALKGKAK